MDTKNVFLSLLILMAPAFSLASFDQTGSIPAQIKSVNESKTKVLIESSRLRTVKPGDILNLDDDCTLEVTQKNGSQAVLNADICNNKQLLEKGSLVELQTSLINDTKQYRNSNSNSNLYSGVITKGFRIDFIKSFLDGKLTITERRLSESGSGNVEHDYGLGFGYADIGISTVGYITRLIYTQYNNDTNSLRIDGSATYGLNQNLYLLGGLNLHKFTKGADKFNVGLGFQVGAGIQINENLGLGISYVTLNNSASVNGVNIDFEAKGLELSLNYTF